MNWKNDFSKENRYFETNNGILYHGDAIKTMNVFPNNIFDLVLTDPPYGTTACKWDSVIPFDEMWEILKKIRKNTTAILLFGSEPFSSLLRISNLKEFKYDWIWHKNSGGGFATAKKRPMTRHEIISVFYKKSPIYNPIFQPYRESVKKRFKDGEMVNRKKEVINPTNQIHGGLSFEGKTKIDFKRGKYPETVQYFKSVPNCNGIRKHPTQKPLALIEYLIKTYTNERDLVLDFTCGSGTTLVACEKLNRRWVGIEIDEKYCEITKQRIKEGK